MKKKILWISDIHLKATKIKGKLKLNYGGTGDNDFVSDFFEEFKKEIEKFLNEIDAVIITGDLAFNGSKYSYDLLKEKLKFITDKDIPVVQVPGNHDVNWDKFELDFYRTKGDFFKSRKEKLKNSFNNFKGYFENYSDGLLYEFNDEERFKLFGESIKSGLSGCIIDKSKKIIYVLINSAWFSVGASYEDWLIDNKKKFKLEDIINLVKISQEAGNLITGVNIEDNSIFDSKQIIKVLENEENKDYLKITCMHHPIDWLDWTEFNIYKSNKSTFLQEIIKKSHLFLTGHIHPSKEFKGEYLLNNTVHLRAPMFLNYGPKKEQINSDLGFAILNFDNFNLDIDYFYCGIGGSAKLSFEKINYNFPVKLNDINTKNLIEKLKSPSNKNEKRSIQKVDVYNNEDKYSKYIESIIKK